MKISKKSGIVTLLAASVLLAVIFAPSISANANKTKSEKALEYVSQKHGIPKERLVITNEKEANFSLSNQKIWSVNILDLKGKEFYYMDLDEAGNIADIKAAKALEYAKYREKYGKKEIALHEKLQKMNQEDTVEVGIWLSPIVDAPKPEREISEQEYKEILDAKRKAYAQKAEPVLDILKAKNINIRYSSQYAPLIYAEVPVKLMAEVENITDVDGIYLAREFKPLLDKVAQTARVQSVWNAGINGSGIKVAVVEEGAINFSNPYLNQGIYNDSAGMISNHATEVAGIIASQHPTYNGISYGVPGLLSANFGPWDNSDPAMESRIIRASEWAINNGANILSNSWGNNTNGTMSGIDKYFDHVVWENWKTVTVVAGNEGQTTGNVVSPGLGYNVITVGGFEDKNDSLWSNDTMWAGSSYVDPGSRNGDREKPEVAAVATHISESSKIITTKGPAPPIGQTVAAGTSYAAPAVAAEAALLMQANSSLTNWPEVIKAIIMASAVHNIEGDSRLSEKDGTGGIDISNAYDTGITEASGINASASDFPKHFTFSATDGQRVRVVITWDSHPDSNHPPVNDDLQSDLNLVVYSPSGAAVGTSDSYDNSYEIVEFTAPATGTYDATVYAKTFNGSYEYLGFAKTVPSLSGWSYRKQKTINGTTAGAQTNYQMKLMVYNSSGTDTLGNVYLNGNARSDFGDLRFTKSDGVTLLDYWIESYTSGVNATVWVEVDSIPASPNTADIYLYYGNPYAASASSGTSTFVFFDEFTRANSSAVGNGWTDIDYAANGYRSPGAITIESNRLKSVYDSTAAYPAADNKISINAEFYIGSHPESLGVLVRGVNTYVAPNYNHVWVSGYGWLYRKDLNALYIYDNGGDASGGGISLSLNTYTWYSSEMKIAENNSLEVRLWQTGTAYPGSPTITKAANTPAASYSYMRVGEGGYTDTFSLFDNIRIRKYASPEPAWGV